MAKVYRCETCGKPGIVEFEGGEVLYLQPTTFITFGIHPDELQASWKRRVVPLVKRSFHFCGQESVAGAMADIIAKTLGCGVSEVDDPHYRKGEGHWITAISKRESGNVILFNIQLSKSGFIRVLEALRKIPCLKSI